jgi:hypothetical protein
MYTFEDGVLKIWDPKRTEIEEPIILQPFDPETSEAWASEADASTWAEKMITELGIVALEEEPASPEEGTDPVLVAEGE